MSQEVAKALKQHVKDMIQHEANPDSVRIWHGHILDLSLEVAGDTHRFLSGMPESQQDWVSLHDMLPRPDTPGGLISSAAWDRLETNLLRPLRQGPVLPDFTLQGPLDLHLTPPSQLQMWLPHSVEMALVNRVLLREGAAVTVRGARSVGLRRAVDLPSVSVSDFVDVVTEDQERRKAAGIMHLTAGLRQRAVQRWNATAGSDGQGLSPALVGLDIAFAGAPGTEHGTLIAATDGNVALQPLKVKRLGQGVVELAPRIGPVHAEGSKALAMAPTTPYAWPLRSSTPDTLDTYERLLREVLSRHVFSKEAGLPRIAPDLPLRLHRSAAEAVTLMQVDVEVTRRLDSEDPEKGKGASSPPTPQELLFAMATHSGRRRGSEVWRSTLKIDGNAADGSLKFQPVHVAQVEVQQDSVTFAPGALERMGLGNGTRGVVAAMRRER